MTIPRSFVVVLFIERNNIHNIHRPTYRLGVAMQLCRLGHVVGKWPSRRSQLAIMPYAVISHYENLYSPEKIKYIRWHKNENKKNNNKLTNLTINNTVIYSVSCYDVFVSCVIVWRPNEESAKLLLLVVGRPPDVCSFVFLIFLFDIGVGEISDRI